MTHFELVQLATDLLCAVSRPDQWLAKYDLALSSDTDQELTELVALLQRELRPSARMAA